MFITGSHSFCPSVLIGGGLAIIAGSFWLLLSVQYQDKTK